MQTTANIKLFFVALALLVSSVARSAGPHTATDIFQEIASYIKAADAEKLAECFGSHVDLLLPDVDKTCPKSQAAALLKEFFAQHKPDSYATLHVGGKNDKHYGIGLLTTPDGRFRTTIFLQANETSYTIQQLRIENDDL